jgi:hypothetical protein
MSSNTAGRYEFDDDLPLNPIDPGSTVLVAGPAFSRAEDLVRSMVAEGTNDQEGALFISTGLTCKRVLETCQRTYPSFDHSRMGVIDCSGQDIGKSDLDIRVRYVSTQSDLTGIGMKFSALYESLYPDARDGRVRTSLISLSSLSMYVDLRTLFQFAQTLSGRIDSAGGLGVFAVDPTTHETKTVNTLSQAADGRIEVRDDTETEGVDGQLRIRGLPDQPSGWQSFSLSS